MAGNLANKKVWQGATVIRRRGQTTKDETKGVGPTADLRYASRKGLADSAEGGHGGRPNICIDH